MKKYQLRQMMRFIQPKSWVAFFALLTIPLTMSCSRQTPDYLTYQQLPIQLALSQSPLNLDPRYATDAASERINRLIYQALVDFDGSSKPVASLASWVEINALEYRFTLESPHSTFHHGKALTADDVKATYDSIAMLRNSAFANEFTNIASITVLDSSTIVFKLKQKDEHFPAKLIIGILPADLIAKQHDFSHWPVGSGPLKFIAWESKLLLERVADHQRISLVEVKDPTVRVLKLLRGEVDLLQGDLPPELVKYLETQKEINVKASNGSNFSYLGLNMQDDTLKNLKVRLALVHSINRQAIVEKVMVKNTRVAENILPPEHYSNHPSAVLNVYQYNPALAKKLLIEAGIQLPLHLVYKTSTDAQRVRFAIIMQAQMRPAGIHLEIRSLDWGTFFDDVKQGNFQLFGLTWVGINTPEIYTKAFGSNSFPPNGFNRGRYSNIALDQFLASEDWPAVTQMIHQQLPYIPLWYEGQFAAMRNNIQNYAPKPNGNWDDLARIKRTATIH